MWFNNVSIYQYSLPKDVDLEACLQEHPLKPCPPHARSIQGWLPALGDQYTHAITGSTLICLGKEERILPRPVINQFLEERIKDIETREGRSIKRSERAQIAEDIEFDLLPKSFAVQKQTFAILDSVQHRLLINTPSEPQASQFIAILRKSVPEISIQPLAHTGNLTQKFTQWMVNPNALPSSFELASDCLLISPKDEKKKVNCKGYELPAKEITTLLSEGLAASEISLIWNERIQLTLTDNMTFKRVKCMDYLNDEFHEIKQLEEEIVQQDTALALLTGELRQLCQSLGEHVGWSSRTESINESS